MVGAGLLALIGIPLLEPSKGCTRIAITAQYRDSIINFTSVEHMNMQVAVEDADLIRDAKIDDVDAITKRISATIPAAKVSQEYNRELSRLSSSVSLKGFRPGKAPRELVEKAHGERIRAELARSMVSKVLVGISKTHKLEVVGYPEIDHGAVDPKSDFTVTASVSLYPRPQITNFDGLKIEVEKQEVGDKDIETAMQELRDSRASLRPLAGRDSAQNGDLVEIELQIVDPTEDKPAQAEPVSLVLGAKRMPSQLEDAIVGAKVGSSGQAKVPMLNSKSGGSAEDESNTLLYNYTVKSIQERILPEVDDGFVASLDAGAATVLELRMKIREHLEKSAEQTSKGSVHSAIIDKLVESNEFQIPQIMVDDEIRSMLVGYGAIDPNKTDPAGVSVEPFRDGLGAMAEKRVRSAVIVDQIATQEKIEPSEEEIEEQLNQIGQANRVTATEVRTYLIRSGRFDGLKRELARSKTLEFLSSKAAIKFKKPSEEAQAK